MEKTARTDRYNDTHEAVTALLHDIYIKKNADYGDSFAKSIKEFGLISPLIRMTDKLNRLKTLVNNSAAVQGESVQDTLLDLANYAILTIMHLPPYDKIQAKLSQPQIFRINIGWQLHEGIKTQTLIHNSLEDAKNEYDSLLHDPDVVWMNLTTSDNNIIRKFEHHED